MVPGVNPVKSILCEDTKAGAIGLSCHCVPFARQISAWVSDASFVFQLILTLVVVTFVTLMLLITGGVVSVEEITSTVKFQST